MMWRSLAAETKPLQFLSRIADCVAAWRTEEGQEGRRVRQGDKANVTEQDTPSTAGRSAAAATRDCLHDGPEACAEFMSVGHEMDVRGFERL